LAFPFGTNWRIWFDEIFVSNERVENGVDVGIKRDLGSIRRICSINKSTRHNAEEKQTISNFGFFWVQTFNSFKC
jgi:hypothetical protein